MAVEVVIPRLGWTMEEGTLTEWMKQDGDTVAQGDVLFTVETDKSLNEVESFDTGVLRIPPDSPSPGTALPVGTLLAYLVQPGEPAPFEVRELSDARGDAGHAADRTSSSIDLPIETGEAATTARDSQTDLGAAPADTGDQTEPAISPRARRIAAELGVEWTGAAGSGRTGRIVERDIQAIAAQQGETAQPQPVAAQPPPGTATTQPAATEAEAGGRGIKASPLAKRLAKEAGIDLAALAVARPGAVIQRADVEEAIAERKAGAIRSEAEEAASPRVTAARPATAETRPADAIQAEADVHAIKASPLAKRLAKEAGIDLAALAVARPGAVIQRADVEAAIAARQAAHAPEQKADKGTTESGQGLGPVIGPETSPAPQVEAHGQAASLARGGFARSIAESAHVTAPVTLVTEADATELVVLRDKTGAALSGCGAKAPTCDDLIIKLVAVALKYHPLLNSSWQDGQVIQHPAIHIGLAVDTAVGPVFPVVHDARSRSLREMAALSSSLRDSAQDQLLAPDDLAGATFTICSLGDYGVDAFTPIVNLPQCAVLGLGRIARKPAVHEGQIVPRDLLTLSLTFDHRIVDGAPAARFLSTIREYVEQPVLWLSML